MTRTVVDGQTITTNNRERELKMWLELPADVRGDFNYIFGGDVPTEISVEGMPEEAYNQRFFRFRDSWWDSHEFERAPDELKARGWDGVMGTSYWDAVVLRYFDRDGYELEGVVVGHATW